MFFFDWKQPVAKSAEGVKASRSLSKSGKPRSQNFIPISVALSRFHKKGVSGKIKQEKSKNSKKRALKTGALFLCLVFSSAAFPQMPVPQSAVAGGPNGRPPFHGFSTPPPSGPSFPQIVTAHSAMFFTQFVIFQLAISGRIYREYYTDSLFYKAPRNPEPGELARHQFGFNPLLSFGGFYGTSILTESGMRKLGDKVSHPLLKKLLLGMAGAAGMGMGYFVSQMFSEALEDGPLFRKCVRDMMSDEEGQGGLYIPTCRQLYLNWLGSGKWKEYFIDIGVMITAGKLAELINRGGAALAARTSIGSYLLKIRFVPFAGAALTYVSAFYTFLEVNGLLDKYVGNPIKNRFLINDTVMDIRTFNEDLSELNRKKLSLLTGQNKDFVMEAVEVEGKGNQTTEVEGKGSQTKQENLKWMVETDKGKDLFMAVISRMNPRERRTLDTRLKVNAMKRVRRLGGDAVNWESPEEEEEPVLRDMIVLRGVLSSFQEAEKSGKHLPGHDKLKSLHQEIQDLREDMVSRIQTIGFRFARWASIAGRDYQEAFFSWKNKIERTTLPYTSAEDLLKDLHDSSKSIEQLRKEMKEETSLIEKRSGETSKYSSDPEKEKDYYDKKLTETRARYNKLIRNRLKFFTFYEDRIEENRDLYISYLCPYLEDGGILAQLLWLSYEGGGPGWLEWCHEPETTILDPRFLVYQTAPVLNVMLKEKFPEFYNDNSYDETALLKAYLSNTPDELFANGNISKNYSGDIQIGALSLDRADLPTKTLIARAFLSALEAFPLAEEQAPPVNETAWQNMLEVSCFVEDDPSKCRSLAEKSLRKKLAAGAFSLLKELLNAPPQNSDYITAKDSADEERHLRRGFPLTGFAEVYKGPEQIFAEDTLFASSTEKRLSPYTFLHDFICGAPTGMVDKDGWFSAPKMFPDLSSLCDFLNSNKTDSTDKDPALNLRNRYFHTPVQIGQTLYPSVYEAVEAQIINRFYRSEREKGAFFDEFSRQTEGSILTATQTWREDLKNLKANYIVPGLIDKTAVDRTQCHSLRDYYGMESYQVTEINRGLFQDPLRIDYLEEQMESLKGLEIYLFQVHFWLERIRTVHYTMKGEDLKSFDPSTEPTDNIICVVLEHLKRYHDSYTEGYSPIRLTWEEAEKLKDSSLSDALTEISTKSIHNGNTAVLIPPSLMFSLILKAVAPDWENRFNLLFSNEDFAPQTKQEAILHALITELKKSLNGFYLTLSLLNLSDCVEDTVHRRQSCDLLLSE